MALEKKKGHLKSLATWMKSRQAPEKLPKSPPKIVKGQDLVDRMEDLSDEGDEESIELSHAAPEIKCLRRRGTITGVEIKCTCGEEVVLTFDYEHKTI